MSNEKTLIITQQGSSTIITGTIVGISAPGVKGNSVQLVLLEQQVLQVLMV
jgi:hypothetical protein